MDDIVVVKAADGTEEGLDQLDNVGFAIVVPCFDLGEELDALDLFEYEVDILLGFVYFMKSNQVFVLNLSRDVDLINQRALQSKCNSIRCDSAVRRVWSSVLT